MDHAAQFGADGTPLLDATVPQASQAVKSRTVAKSSARTTFAEQVFVVIVLVLSTTAFVNLFPGESGTEFQEQGMLFAQILWAVLYAVMLFFIRKNVKEFVRLLWGNKFLVALFAWTIISVTWSIDRQVTVRHFAALMLTSLFGVYFGVRYSLREQLRFLLIAVTLVIAASVIACLVFPDYAITIADASEGPSWQGVVTHRNTLGRLAVLEALILVFYYIQRFRRPLVLIGIILLIPVVLLTQSKSALIYFIFGLAVFPLVRAFQTTPDKRVKILWVAAVMFASVAVWGFYNWERFTVSLGRDPELTGRLALWVLAVSWISQKPLVGYGFDAFWSNYYGPAADFRIASGWLVAPHAHNGILNLWLDLGFIGVILFLLGFIFACRQAYLLAKNTHAVEGLWPLVFLTFFFVYSITELGFLSRNELFWMLYVGVMVGLSVRLKALKRDGRESVP